LLGRGVNRVRTRRERRTGYAARVGELAALVTAVEAKYNIALPGTDTPMSFDELIEAVDTALVARRNPAREGA
jgi:hypothetical protein